MNILLFKRKICDFSKKTDISHEQNIIHCKTSVKIRYLLFIYHTGNFFCKIIFTFLKSFALVITIKSKYLDFSTEFLCSLLCIFSNRKSFILYIRLFGKAIVFIKFAETAVTIFSIIAAGLFLFFSSFAI